ncbi:Hypothetical predicted protein, partial [Marmota monax]
ITVAVPPQGFRPQCQSRSPTCSPTQDYQAPQQDHWHQHPPKTHMLLSHQTLSSYPCTETAAVTKVWNPIYQHGAPRHSSLSAPRDIAQALMTADSHQPHAAQYRGQL